jgi:hypothetical protein
MLQKGDIYQNNIYPVDHEFCSVRYSSIDDAVKIIQRLGRGTKLSKCDIKSVFRLLRIFPGDFDQLEFVRTSTGSTVLSSARGTPHDLQTS